MYFLMKRTVFFKLMGVIGITNNGDLLRGNLQLGKGYVFGSSQICPTMEEHNWPTTRPEFNRSFSGMIPAVGILSKRIPSKREG